MTVFAGEIILGERDPYGVLLAFENLGFFFGMLGIALSLAVLLQLFRGKMEKVIYGAVDKAGALFSREKKV